MNKLCSSFGFVIWRSSSSIDAARNPSKLFIVSCITSDLLLLLSFEKWFRWLFQQLSDVTRNFKSLNLLTVNFVAKKSIVPYLTTFSIYCVSLVSNILKIIPIDTLQNALLALLFFPIPVNFCLFNLLLLFDWFILSIESKTMGLWLKLKLNRYKRLCWRPVKLYWRRQRL